MTPHTHREYVDGCFRCELSRYEEDHAPTESHKCSTRGGTIGAVSGGRVAQTTDPQATPDYTGGDDG